MIVLSLKMKLFHGIVVASSIAVSPVYAFITPAPRQRVLIGNDASNSPMMIQSLRSPNHSPLPPLSPLFAGGKEIDLLKEADAIFDAVDVNDDGTISYDELRAHLVDQMGYTTEYTKFLFSSLDTDADGQITRQEMRFAFYNFEALSLYMTFGVGGSELTSREAFKSFVFNQDGGRDKLMLDDLADLIFDMIDTDGSGTIDTVELRKHFQNVTSKFDEDIQESQAKEYVDTMLASLDANKDGGIDREEVQAAFQKYDFKLLAETFGLRVYRTTLCISDD